MAENDAEPNPQELFQALDEALDSLFEGDPDDEPPSDDPSIWYSFDLGGQAIDALRHVADLLPQTPNDPYLWKWVVIGTFDALQGFFGLALRRGDGAQLLSRNHENRTYERWRKERDLGTVLAPESRNRIDDTRGLYEKIQDPERMQHFMSSKPFVPSETQEEAFAFIAGLRHDLTHYGHGSRVVRIAQLPEVVLDCVSIINWLLEESHTIALRQDEEDRALEMTRRVTYEAKRLAALRSLESFLGDS